MIKKAICTSVVLFLLFTLPACSSKTQPVSNKENFITVVDSRSQEISLPSKPKHTVVLTSSLMEIQHAVGGDFDAWADSINAPVPDYAKGKKTVGHTYRVNPEILISLKPDLVIGLNGLHNGLEQVLKENSIPFVLLTLSSYEDVRKAVMIMADMSGNHSSGVEVLQKMDKSMEETVNRIPKDHFTFAVIHGTGKSISVERPGSIACDTALRLGFKNAFPEIQGDKMNTTAPFSMEALVKADPDIIFLTTMVTPGREQEVFQASLVSHPAWESLKAVKTGRVYYLPQQLFLTSPGIHYPDALKFMASLVYSDMDW